MQAAYTIFVHLIDGNGLVRAQSDRAPWDGMFPTDRWAVGETVQDDYTLQLPADLAPGEYSLRVGIYLDPTQPVQTTRGERDVMLDSKIRVLGQ
jgi:hypothetical protein